MKRLQDQSGITLVELLVTIVVSSIVMFAATSMLLMGIRMGAFGNKNTSTQNKIQVFQKMVSEAEIAEIDVEPVIGFAGIDGKDDSCKEWSIKVKQGEEEEDATGLVILSFKNNTIYLGTSESSILLENVETQIALDNNESEKKYLISFKIKKDGKEYLMSFCKAGNLTVKGDQKGSGEDTSGENKTAIQEVRSSRMITFVSDYAETDTMAEVDSKTAKAKALEAIKELSPSAIAKVGREKFIDCLFKQIDSKGEIVGMLEDYPYEYYSEWYIGGYKEGSDWNANTPWCACYISWILEDFQDTILEHTPRFADVVEGAVYFQNCEKEMYGTVSHWCEPENAEPLPGDLVFFDWDENEVPEHVGVVLYTENGKLYTIEGNVDDQVKTVSYSLQDSTILGYGSLHWK